MTSIKLVANKIYHAYKDNTYIYSMHNTYTDNELYNIILEIFNSSCLIDYTNYKFLYMISDMILQLKHNMLISNILSHKYLLFVIKHQYGFIILYRLHNKIKIPFNMRIYNIFRKYSSYKTFIYVYYHLLDYKKEELSSPYKLIINTINNSDDRIFKFLVSTYFNSKTNTKIKTMDIINTLLGTNKSMKIKLQKLKLIINYINNCEYNDMCEYFETIILNIHDEKTLLYLHKHYNKYYTFKTLNLMVTKIIDIMNIKSSTYNEIGIVMNEMKSIIEDVDLYYLFMIIIYMKDKHGSFSTMYNNNKLMTSTINKNIDIILDEFYNNNLFELFINKMFANVFKLINHDIINNYVIKNKYTNLCFFTKFLIIPNDIHNNDIYDDLEWININKLLHLLRIKMKSVYRNKLKKHYIYHAKLIDEIKYYEPNHIKVLQNGSLNYQYEHDKFPIIKTHCFSNYKSIITNIMPLYVQPSTDIFKNYNIYAEYIEEFDIYLVHDIEIPWTTEKERRDLLKNSHKCCEFNDYLSDDNISLWFYLQ